MLLSCIAGKEVGSNRIERCSKMKRSERSPSAGRGWFVCVITTMTLLTLHSFILLPLINKNLHFWVILGLFLELWARQSWTRRVDQAKFINDFKYYEYYAIGMSINSVNRNYLIFSSHCYKLFCFVQISFVLLNYLL